MHVVEGAQEVGPLTSRVLSLLHLIADGGDREQFFTLLSAVGRYRSAPSNLFPASTSRSFPAAVESWILGRKRLLEQTFQVTDWVEGQSTVAVCFRWSGTLAGDIPGLVAGTRLVTDSVGFYTFMGGTIFDIRLWDSYIQSPD